MAECLRRALACLLVVWLGVVLAWPQAATASITPFTTATATAAFTAFCALAIRAAGAWATFANAGDGLGFDFGRSAKQAFDPAKESA